MKNKPVELIGTYTHKSQHVITVCDNVHVIDYYRFT